MKGDNIKFPLESYIGPQNKRSKFQVNFRVSWATLVFSIVLNWREQRKTIGYCLRMADWIKLVFMPKDAYHRNLDSQQVSGL